MKDIIDELFEDFYALSYEGMELYSYKSLGIIALYHVCPFKTKPFSCLKL